MTAAQAEKNHPIDVGDDIVHVPTGRTGRVAELAANSDRGTPGAWISLHDDPDDMWAPLSVLRRVDWTNATEHHTPRGRTVLVWLVAAAILGACVWFAATQLAATTSAVTAPSEPPAAATATSPEPDDSVLDTPSALPATDRQVVDAHALGFLTALIRDGVPVDGHEHHLVMVAETMCTRSGGEAWIAEDAPEKEDVAQVLFPHWSDAEAEAYVNAAHHYCHALNGDTHDTGHS